MCSKYSRPEISDRPTLLVLASTYPRWADDPEPGFVHALAQRLVSRFRVVVVCPHAPGAARHERLDGVEVVRYRYAPCALQTLVQGGGIVANLRRAPWKFVLLPGFIIGQLWTAWRLVRRERVTLIHAHWLIPQGLVAALVSQLCGVPYVATAHGADVHALRTPRLRRYVARHAAMLTVVSTALEAQLRAEDLGNTRMAVLPMGVDCAQRFTPAAQGARSAQELLFVGRLVEKKGLDHLLCALPTVRAQYPALRLHVIGVGPMEAALRAQTARLGLSDAVVFHGALPQAALPQWYRRAALFVAPFVRAASGDEDGLGLVLIEAIACECPVLVGDVPAVADVLGPDRGVWVVDPRQTAHFAERILARLADPKTEAERARALRARIAARFHWDAVADAYAQVFESCLRTVHS